jgi:hypothetical protein
MILHNNRYIDHWSRIESPELNPHIYGQLIFNKGAQNIQWDRTVSSVKDAEKLDIHKQKMKQDLHLTPKFNSKWIRLQCKT